MKRSMIDSSEIGIESYQLRFIDTYIGSIGIEHGWRNINPLRQSARKEYRGDNQTDKKMKLHQPKRLCQF